MKIVEQKKAKELRTKGFSLSEIQRELKVSKSSVSLWVRDIKLTPEALRIIQGKFTKGQLRSQEVLRTIYRDKINKIKTEVSETFSSFERSKINSLIICSLLYWCEGNKRINDGISFTNSDPKLIRTFISLLREVFPLDERKFRVCMHLHPYHNEKKQKLFWSEVTQIPFSQFTKSYRKQNSKKYKKEGYQGCIRVRYHNSLFTHKLSMISSMFMGMFN